MKKKALIIILVLIVFAACSNDNLQLQQEEVYEGLYEGSLDENGMRSGRGVWIFQNFRYEGRFWNDVPSLGTLYWQTPEGDVHILQGGFVHGYADGIMYYSVNYSSPDDTVWVFAAEMGLSATEHIKASSNGQSFELDTTNQIYGVPPWAEEVVTDSSIEAPIGGNAPVLARGDKR